MKNNVHKYKGVWWFWDKRGRRIGSYTTRIGATIGLQNERKKNKEKEKTK